MTPTTLHDAVLDALALPDSCRVDQRVPKKMLVEYGAPTAADKRLLTDAIEEIQWRAALKPATVAVPPHRDEVREYLEVAVLSVQIRSTHAKPAQVQRLTELLHRAVPYPVLLIVTAPQGVVVSMAHKRAAQNEAGKVVLDGELTSLHLVTSQPADDALLLALALDRQPHANLMALYQGWMDCLTAAQASRITGRFDARVDRAEAETRRAALRDCQRLEQEAARLRGLAAKERQIAKQVDLNLALQRVRADLAVARARL